MPASERLSWAAAVVEARPGERVLEVGCGHGVLVGLLADRGASVAGVDRSARMTAAAARRNASAALAAGQVSLATGALVDVALDGPFDVVAAFDVRAFWTPPAAEWDVVLMLLAPGGRVVIAWSVMDAGSSEGRAALLAELAGARGFVVRAVHRAATRPFGSAAAVLGRGSDLTPPGELTGDATLKRPSSAADHPVR